MRNPIVTITKRAAEQKAGVSAHKTLVVGQKCNDGSATANKLYTEISSEKQISALFGAKSQLAQMLRAFRKAQGKSNTPTRLDAIALSDAENAAAASATVTFEGNADTSGVLSFSLSSHSYSLDISEGQTAAQIATALSAAINADLSAPSAAGAQGGVVTFTAANKGKEANSLALFISCDIGGITSTLTAFSGGSGDPDTTGIFDLIGTERYQTIVVPSYALDTAEDFLSSRWNAKNNILDGIVISSKAGTFSELKTWGQAKNSQIIVLFGLKASTSEDLKGPGEMVSPCEASAIVGALRALRLTEGSDLTEYVTAKGANDDYTGGPALASLPYFNTPVYGINPIKSGHVFSEEEAAELLAAGINTFGNNNTATLVLLGDLVTTYKTDLLGNKDISYKYLNYVDTYSLSAEYIWTSLKNDYAQTRLTDGELRDGRAFANADKIKGSIIQYFAELSTAKWSLTPGGEEAMKYFKKCISVSLNISTGTAKIISDLPIVTQLREIIATAYLKFGTKGE